MRQKNEEEFKRQFAKRLATAMQVAGLTAASLSRKTNISRSTITSYKKARALPSLEALIRLAESLDVSIDWLLTGKQQPYISSSDLERLHSIVMEARANVGSDVERAIVNVVRERFPEMADEILYFLGAVPPHTLKLMIEAERARQAPSGSEANGA